jgi:hypothetical protein
MAAYNIQRHFIAVLLRLETKMTSRAIHASPLVEDLLMHFTKRWWETEVDLPALGPTYTPVERRVCENQLDGFTNLLVSQSRHPPNTPAESKAFQDRLVPLAVELFKVAFGIEERHLAAIRSYGFIEAAQEFTRQARRFDPALGIDEIFQASRNVWSMNLTQLLFGLPVEVTPAVFAYSMLYPYTDNYLDDPRVSAAAKRRFIERFRLRLEGQPLKPENDNEQKIGVLVEFIESSFERKKYPQVYENLLALHSAQGRSLALMLSDTSPYEVDALGICFEKGGLSTLADAYLVAGELTEAQREFAFYYGCVTQLVDDLEDVHSDAQAGIKTVFSQTAGRWPLDGITNRALHFSLGMVGDMHRFDAPDLEPLKEMIQISLTPLFITSAGRLNQYYSKPYLHELQTHFPFRFGYLYQQRKKLYRHKKALYNLAEAVLVT